MLNTIQRVSFWIKVHVVMPAQAGIQIKLLWIPACAGMTLFFCWTSFIFIPLLQAAQNIEIFAGNKKFSSFEKYKKFRVSDVEEVPALLGSENAESSQRLSHAFHSFILGQEHPEEFNFDSQKVRTIELQAEPSISIETKERLKSVDLQSPVKKTLNDFVQDSVDNDAKQINIFQDDLEGLLQSTVGNTEDPQLYLMDKDRLRIMSLTPSPNP